MGIFDPFGDIDNTKEGHIYVVDHTGWGWFAFFILMALPFFLISLMLWKYANAVCNHPLIAALIYCLLVSIIAAILYRSKQAKYRFSGIIATVFTMLPLAAVQIVYAIPYILTHDAFLGVTFEWLVVTFFLLAITVFVLSIANFLQNGFIHLIIAIAFVAATTLILKPPENLSWDYVLHLYSIE